MTTQRTLTPTDEAKLRAALTDATERRSRAIEIMRDETDSTKYMNARANYEQALDDQEIVLAQMNEWGITP
jgi:hypothetical protein